VTRIGAAWSALRARKAKGFVAFVTAGDPSLERTVEVALEAEKGGADVLELGLPFSDPLADGPVIQRSSERALRAGVTLPAVLQAVRQSSSATSTRFCATACSAWPPKPRRRAWTASW
jgi:tryptophan synthase alpha chain